MPKTKVRTKRSMEAKLAVLIRDYMDMNKVTYDGFAEMLHEQGIPMLGSAVYRVINGTKANGKIGPKRRITLDEGLGIVKILGITLNDLADADIEEESPKPPGFLTERDLFLKAELETYLRLQKKFEGLENED